MPAEDTIFIAIGCFLGTIMIIGLPMYACIEFKKMDDKFDYNDIEKPLLPNEEKEIDKPDESDCYVAP